MARKKQRETYGNGSITPKKGKDGKQMTDRKGNPIWRVCLTFGKDENGKRRKIQRVVHGTLADARKVVKELNEQYADVEIDNTLQSFKKTCTMWAASMRNANTCSAAKLKDYETMLDHVAVELGTKPIAEIKAHDIEMALDAVRTKRQLSQRRIRDTFIVVKRVFEYAIRNEWLVKNPCAPLDAPRVTQKPDRNSLTPQDAARLRQKLDEDEEKAYEDLVAKEERLQEWSEGRAADKTSGRSEVHGISRLSYLMTVRLLLATGARRGEICALSWEHIDLDSGQVKILQAITSDGKLKAPKTANAVRTICIDADTISHLRRWKKFQKEVLQLIQPEAGDEREPIMQTDSTPVIVSNSGTWIWLRNFTHWWDRYREVAGFPGLRVHELRHTAASLLLANGMDVLTVSNRLGHASPSITLDVYSHCIPGRDAAAADLMGSILAAPAQPEAPTSSPNQAKSNPKKSAGKAPRKSGPNIIKLDMTA